MAASEQEEEKEECYAIKQTERMCFEFCELHYFPVLFYSVLFCLLSFSLALFWNVSFVECPNVSVSLLKQNRVLYVSVSHLNEQIAARTQLLWRLSSACHIKRKKTNISAH